MSQLQIVESEKPKEVHEKTVTTDTSQSEKSIVTSVFFLALKKIFESVDTPIISPVKVEGDTIKLTEYLMTENQPYAFSYKEKDYVVTRKKDKTQLFELK